MNNFRVAFLVNLGPKIFQVIVVVPCVAKMTVKSFVVMQILQDGIIEGWDFPLIRLIAVIVPLDQFRGCSKSVEGEDMMGYMIYSGASEGS